MLELADRRDLGSRAATRESSTLSFPIQYKIFNLKETPLNIEKVIQEDRQAKITVEYSAAEFEGFKRRAAKKISSNTKIPGFRPGKVPYHVVVNRYGEEAVVQEAFENLVDADYSKILEEAKIEPSGAGSLEKVENLDPPKFILYIPLEPEVELGEYHDIRIDYELEDFDETEVDRYIMSLRRNSATILPADRPAQEDDLVYFNLSGEFLNPEENEDETIADKTPQQVVIPSEDDQSDKEWPYAGFARSLLGVRSGDVKEIQYTYPDDYQAEDYRGKTAIFTVDVQSVKALELPAFDEDFVQSMGDFETPEDFREAIEQKMREEQEQNYENEYFDKVLTEVTDNAKINYPPQMLEQEEEHILQSIKSRLERQNLDFDTFLKLRDKDEETFMEEEVLPRAKQSLVRKLVVEALINAEGLKLDQATLNDQINSIMGELFQSGNIEEIQKELRNEDVTRAISMEGFTRAMSAQLMNRMKLIATGQPIPEDEEEVDSSEPTDEVELTNGSKTETLDANDASDEEVSSETDAQIDDEADTDFDQLADEAIENNIADEDTVNNSEDSEVEPEVEEPDAIPEQNNLEEENGN